MKTQTRTSSKDFKLFVVIFFTATFQGSITGYTIQGLPAYQYFETNILFRQKVIFSPLTMMNVSTIFFQIATQLFNLLNSPSFHTLV